MLLSPNTKVLTAIVLAATLVACTTTKKADDSATAAQANADRTVQTNTDAAKSNAASTGSNLNSQALADAKSNAAQAANDLAAQLGIKVFHFDYDSSSIADNDKLALRAHATYLSKNPSARVRVEGNTDERGTREYNMALGERRAKSVAAFLTSNGAKSSQLEVISYGEEKPVATGESEEAWAQNRRVELDYTSGKP